MPSDYIKDITENVDIVEYIGEYVPLTQKGDEYVGLCPFHSERTPSFYVNPTESKWYCFGCKQGGDVIAFSAKVNGTSYTKASQMLADKCGLEERFITPSSAEQIFRKVSRSKAKQNTVRHEILDKKLYDMFQRTQIPLWLDEGIPQNVMDDYEVRMDIKKGRIVYPVYDNNGNFINIKGRTIYPDYKELGEPKYINYFKVGKVDYLQCFSHNVDFIRQTGEMIIFEGIKSVMKLDSFGMKNSVSAETSKINDYQLREIIRMRCSVVFAFDSDVDYGNIIDTVKTLAHFTNVSIIEDVDELLGEKMSPVDKGKEVWEELYKWKRRVMA